MYGRVYAFSFWGTWVKARSRIYKGIAHLSLWSGDEPHLLDRYRGNGEHFQEARVSQCLGQRQLNVVSIILRVHDLEGHHI